jgi:hypothetical protein
MNLKQRLANLEALDGTGTTFAWLDYSETQDQARARWIGANPDKDPATELTFLSWQAPTDSAPEAVAT